MDAVIELACHREGLSPNDPESPNSPSEAFDRFFNPEHKPLHEWKDIRSLADNVCVVVTGQYVGARKREGVNVSIIDQGIGQTPDSFPNTFCALGGSNKLRAFCLHGKHCCGSSAVFRNCAGNSIVALWNA